MHISTKKIAMLGLLLALTVMLIIFSSFFEMSTFFLIALASFLVGIVINELNLSTGLGFYLASVFLSLVLAPNKLYCLTFAMVAAYLVIVEAVRVSLMKKDMKKLASLTPVNLNIRGRRKKLWVVKVVVFNLLYLPMLIFFPKLIFPGELSNLVVIGVWAVGQLVLVAYDFAYQEFVIKHWSRLRKHL